MPSPSSLSTLECSICAPPCENMFFQAFTGQDAGHGKRTGICKRSFVSKRLRKNTKVGFARSFPTLIDSPLSSLTKRPKGRYVSGLRVGYKMYPTQGQGRKTVALNYGRRSFIIAGRDRMVRPGTIWALKFWSCSLVVSCTPRGYPRTMCQYKV